MARVDVYEKLRQEIITGQLSPGAQVTESGLAERFGVSRTPVREALRRLEQDALIERSARGLRVRTRTPEEILEIYEVRIALESLAARIAAARHTDVDSVVLKGLMRRLEELGDADESVRADVNRRFHESVWQASHNRTLIDVLQRLGLHLMRYPFTTLSQPDRWKQALEEHQELLDAILSRDGDRASDVAAEHMKGARETRLTMWQERPGSLDDQSA